MSFQDRVVIVTGAARGIGRATAERFARAGARLVVVDVDPTLHEVAEELTASASGVDVRPVVADVSDARAVTEIVRTVTASHERVDVLVSNAGVSKPTSLVDTRADEWDSIMSVNLRAAFLLMRETAPLLKRQRAGAVVNVASFLATAALESFAAYCASKAGLIGLTCSAALDLAPHGVRVNAVCPGTTDTPMWQITLDQHPDAEEALRSTLELQPLGRLGRPEDVAAAIAFLASDDAAYITGTSLYVDGGVSARLSHV